MGLDADHYDAEQQGKELRMQLVWTDTKKTQKSSYQAKGAKGKKTFHSSSLKYWV